MKIVVVEPLPGGGIFQWALQLADALARAGNDVTILTGSGPEARPREARCRIVEGLPTWQPDDDPDIAAWKHKVRRVWRAALYAEAWRRSIWYVLRHDVDAVHLSDQRFALDCFFVWLLRRLDRKVVIVHTVHNPVPYQQQGAETAERHDRFTLWAFGKSYASCDVLVTLGAGPRQVLLGHWPTLTPPTVIEHGDYSSLLDTGPIADDRPPSSAPPTALFFGNWTRYKNIPLLLEAFALVRSELPAARLVLAGRVPNDIDLTPIEARCREIGNVELKVGYVPLHAIPELVAGSRFVVLPYEVVNVSGVVHLAYSLGRPVVATGVGSMGDSVVDGVTGVVTPPDAAALAAGMLRLLRSPADADRLGRTALEQVSGHSSWDAGAATVLAEISHHLPAGPVVGALA